MINRTKTFRGLILIVSLLSGYSFAQRAGLWTVKPLEYPRMAHAANVQGDIVLSASIGADGVPIEIKRKSGNALLADDIAKQLSQWKFSPSSNGWTADITVKFILAEPHASELKPAMVTI